MKRKFIVEIEYEETEEDIKDLKHSIESVVEELMYDCLEVGQICNYENVKVNEVK